MSHGAGAIFIGPSGTYYAELGELARHTLTVTNNVTHPVLVELSWNAPPPEWFVSARMADGTTPLPDMNGNGRPDVSLGQVRSSTESAVVVIAVQVPLAPPPQLEIATEVVAHVFGTNDSDSAELITSIGPWVELDRRADPEEINIFGSGGVEETTISLSLRGEGAAVNTSAPIDVVFEIDRSGSMSGSDPFDLRVDAVQGYIDRMTPEDRGSVIGFESTAWVVNSRPLTPTDGPGRALLKADADTLRGAGGGTNLDAALQLGTDWLMAYGDPSKNRIEILLTDGIGTNGNTDAILDQAILAGIVIHTVGLGAYADEAYLRHVADRTGGVYLHADSPEQLAELYGQLANRTLETAARDRDPTDYDPMVKDVLPPFINYVFGSAVDPGTGGPRPPSVVSVDGFGNRVLGWNVATLKVNETWTVAFRVTSNLGGVVPTNVYGLSRATFDDWKDRSRTLFFPEVFVTVRSPPPQTSLLVGTPRVFASPVYITSATPLWFTPSDWSGTGIRRTMFRVDGAPWIDFTGGGTFTLFPEGEHLLEWFSEDNIGNMEPARSGVLRVDDSPPQTVLQVGDPKVVDAGITYITSATHLALQATDGGVTPVGVAYVEHRVDEGPWDPYASPFYLFDEGAHSVEFRARDFLGNAEPGHTVTVFVDTTGPLLGVRPGTPVYVAADTWVTSRTPIELTAADRGTPPVGLESFEYQVWSGTWSGWMPYTGAFLLSPEGRHVVELRARDRLGNDAFASTTFYVDDTPPAIALSVSSPNVVDGDTFVSPDTPLSLSAVDGGPVPVGISSFEYRIDGGPWSAYTGVFRLDEEGARVIEYRASDRLGNADVRSATLVVDASPPSIALAVGIPSYTSSNTWITSSTSIELSAVDGGLVAVGLHVLEYRERFGVWSAWTPYSGAFRFQGEGLHSLEVRATDRLGNGALKEFAFVVDDSPPSPLLEVGQPSLATETTFVTSATPITLFAQDQGSIPVGLREAEFRLDSGGWRTYAAPFVVTGEDGPHRVQYRATDRLGNAAAGAMDLLLDNTPPETRVTLSFDPKTREAALALAAEDAGSGLAITESRIVGDTWWPYGTPILLGPGRHVLRYRSADLLGNAEAERVYAVVIPEDGPWVAWNWTPSVAFAFAVVLIGVGYASSRHARHRGTSPRGAANSIGTIGPFVLGELAIGALSVYVPPLRMPPAFGWGTFLLIAFLGSGSAIAWLYARRTIPPPPEDPAIPSVSP